MVAGAPSVGSAAVGSTGAEALCREKEAKNLSMVDTERTASQIGFSFLPSFWKLCQGPSTCRRGRQHVVGTTPRLKTGGDLDQIP